MNDIMAKVAAAVTEHVLLESTRNYLERLVSELVAEDLKDPDVRAWFFSKAKGDYKKARRKLGLPRRKSGR